ncbi:MAG: hypothetical protein HY738_13190 [Bacteroidia bacterium]|nr:hypothetical protein [Bacteroidia bacterium]
MISDITGPILESFDKSVWIGNNCGGLNQIKNGKIIKYDFLKQNSCVWSLVEDKNKILWAGTYGRRSKSNKRRDDFCLYFYFRFSRQQCSLHY